MSLDFYLKGKKKNIICKCECCGHEHEIRVIDTLFEGNITHNLSTMAEAAGIYKCLWRPNENGIVYASEMIDQLEKGLEFLKSKPKAFQEYEAKNGWGTHRKLVEFAERVLKACKENPDAMVEVST